MEIFRPLPKYVGFNHYRRYFIFRNNIPDLDYIFEKYDIILPKHRNFYPTIKRQFEDMHFRSVLDEIIEIIKNIKPQYYDFAIKTLNSTIFYHFNIFIMKSVDFLKWGEFIYPIMNEYDKRHNISNDSDVKNYIVRVWEKYETKELNIDYQRRLEGFVVERLSNIFYNYHFKKKHEINVINYDKKLLTVNNVINLKEIEKQEEREKLEEITKAKEIEKEKEIGRMKDLQRFSEFKKLKILDKKRKDKTRNLIAVTGFLFLLFFIIFVLICIFFRVLFNSIKKNRKKLKKMKIIQLKNVSCDYLNDYKKYFSKANKIHLIYE